MNYPQIYSAVVRYALAPEEEINSILQTEGMDNWNPQDTAAMVLADKLGDYSDPREHIVRGDLALRGGNANSFYTNWDKISPLAVSNIKTKHSRYFEITKKQHFPGNITYNINWKPENSNGVSFLTALPQEEGEQLIKKLHEHGLIDFSKI